MIRIILIVILVLLLVRMFAMSRKSAGPKHSRIRFDSKMYKRKGLTGSIGKLPGPEK